MNIEELNSCFDSVTPTKEQKEKMFASVMNAKKQPVKIVKFNRYATAAAAVLVIGVVGAVYSYTNKHDITDNVNNTTVAMDTEIQNNNEETAGTYVVNENNIAAEDNITVQEFGVKEKIQKSLSQETEEKIYTEEKAEDMPVAAILALDEAQISVKDQETDSVTTEDAEEYSTAFSNVRAGCGSAYSPQYNNLGINEIMSNEVYSKFVPTMYADDFNFVSAEEYENILKIIFENDSGKYMSVSIVKDGEYDFYEKIINPEEIKNIDSHGYLNFAVQCGEYYVIYYVESYDVYGVYNMVTSSEYFNN